MPLVLSDRKADTVWTTELIAFIVICTLPVAYIVIVCETGAREDRRARKRKDAERTYDPDSGTYL